MLLKLEEFYNYKFCRIKRHHDSVSLPDEIEHKVSFQSLNLRQLSVCVVSGTQQRKMISERNDFEKFGTLRKMFIVDGNHSDAILYSTITPNRSE
jgi:hypothetical protein